MNTTTTKRSTLATVTRLFSLVSLTLGGTCWGLLLSQVLSGVSRRFAIEILWLAAASAVVLVLPTVTLGLVLRSRGESARYAGISAGLVGGLMAATTMRALVG